MSRFNRGKRLQGSAQTEEVMNETKRLCTEVDKMNAKLTSLESKMDNKFQTIIDNQNKLLEYLTKIETSLAPVSASLTFQKNSLENLVQHSMGSSDIEALREEMVHKHLGMNQACLMHKTEIDWNIIFDQVTNDDNVSTAIKVKSIEQVVKRRDNILRNFYYKIVKQFYDEFLKDDQVKELRKGIFELYVEQIRIASHKGNKFADIIPDEDLMALVRQLYWPNN